MSDHPATFALIDSNDSSEKRVIPIKYPKTPINIEEPTCPIPLMVVTQTVLNLLQF